MPRFGKVEGLQDAVSSLFPPLRLSAPPDMPYRAEVTDASVGPLAITRISCTPTHLRRSSRMIGSSDPDLVKVTLHRRGSLLVSQDGRHGKIDPGDLVFYDLSRPYELDNPDPCDLIVFALPRSILGPSGDLLSQRTAIPVPSDQGIRSVMATFFTGLADTALAGEGGDLNGPNALRLADAAVSLLITAFTDIPCERVELPTSLTDRILSYALANLHDPGLSVGCVAHRFGISPRYLHTLMRQRDIRFGAWVRRERMKRIRQDLLDPRLASCTAGAIAARWGIPDPDHLSRSLRAEFGQSAAEIRACAGLAHSPSATGPV